MGYGYDGDTMRRTMRGLRTQMAGLRTADRDHGQDCTAIWSAIRALQARRVQVRHVALPLPLLSVGTLEQAIAWSTPLPTATYDVEVSLSTALLGKATITVKDGTRTATGLTIQVTSTALVLAGSALSVLATWQG